MARRTLTIAEEFGAYYVSNANGLHVQSSSLEGALRKAAIALNVAHTDGTLEIRSTQDAVEILETLVGTRPSESGFGAA